MSSYVIKIDLLIPFSKDNVYFNKKFKNGEIKLTKIWVFVEDNLQRIVFYHCLPKIEKNISTKESFLTMENVVNVEKDLVLQPNIKRRYHILAS